MAVDVHATFTLPSNRNTAASLSQNIHNRGRDGSTPTTTTVEGIRQRTQSKTNQQTLKQSARIEEPSKQPPRLAEKATYLWAKNVESEQIRKIPELVVDRAEQAVGRAVEERTWVEAGEVRRLELERVISDLLDKGKELFSTQKRTDFRLYGGCPHWNK